MQGKITQITQLTPDVKSFHIDLPDRPDFLPGQYLVLGLEAQGQMLRRDYSIASPNHWDNMEILVRLHPDGQLTPELFQRQVGDPVDIQMPYGTFFLGQTQIPESMVFIAGGVGLAPVLSMIRHLEWAGHDGEKTLLYGNRSTEDIVHKEELNRLAKAGLLKLVFTVDDPADTWDGETGLITPEMISRNCDADDGHFYICGPPGMVSHMVKNLQDLEVGQDRIHHEKW